jgi:hypothetical protein
MSNDQLASMEIHLVPLVRYRDHEGNPTCATDFPDGRVCIFYATQKFGCAETCWFAEKNGSRWRALERRRAGYGTLIPLSTCPLWPDSRRGL